jgi:ATP-dependent DNA ligase
LFSSHSRSPAVLSRSPILIGVFEIKYTDSRALTNADPSGVRLVLRKSNRFSSFSELCAGIELFLKPKHAILGGEIVCLDDQGHSQFNELLFRRGTPCFCAFDLLHLAARTFATCR